MLKHSLLLAVALVASPACAQESSEVDRTFAAAVADPSRPSTDTDATPIANPRKHSPFPA